MELERNESEMEQIDLHSTASDKLETGFTSSSASTQREYPVELLVVLFGIGSWFGLTTIFSQMPKIGETAPEEWLLPCHLLITSQVGNAVSMLYVYAQNTSARQFNDAHVICMLLATGCMAAILMPFTYHITVGQVSIALHIFTFIFATIGGFSSMLFMAYVKRFRSKYLFIFFLGQALNDILSNAVAAAQGMWGRSECVFRDRQYPIYVRHTASLRFQPNVAFLFVLPVLATSLAAFILLNKMRVCRNELVEIGTELAVVSAERECDSSDTVQELPQLKFFHLILSNALFGFLATSIFPCVHEFTCLLSTRRPMVYDVAIVFIAIYTPLFCLVVTMMSQQCASLVRRCKARIICLVPYLLFYVFGLFWAWPFHSLLGLILLVVSWVFFAGSIILMKIAISNVFRYQNHKLTLLLDKTKPKPPFKPRLF